MGGLCRKHVGGARCGYFPDEEREDWSVRMSLGHLNCGGDNFFCESYFVSYTWYVVLRICFKFLAFDVVGRGGLL